VIDGVGGDADARLGGGRRRQDERGGEGEEEDARAQGASLFGADTPVNRALVLVRTYSAADVDRVLELFALAYERATRRRG